MDKEPELSSPKAKREPSSSFLEFLSVVESESEASGKIRLYIDFMRTMLSQAKGPNFKDFWEVRRLCLPLFKDAGSERALLWEEYTDLSTEARRLKELVEEEAAFAAEQIDLALDALEKDVGRFEELSAQLDLPFPDFSRALSEKKEVYFSLQRELYLLNTLAARVQGLRKEVLKTALRPKVKSKFLDRLSAYGDLIFPRRKELIQQVSQQFITDVNSFVESSFNREGSKMPPLFVLKDEIKAFQGLAKHLTLSTQAFNETRLKLSECWDLLKEWDKERKEELAEKKEEFQKNFDLVMQKILELQQIHTEQGEMKEDEELLQTEEILQFMRKVELGRDEVKKLKEEIARIRQPLLEKREAETLKRQHEEEERGRLKKEKLSQFKEGLSLLLSRMQEMDVEALMQERDQLLEVYGILSLMKAEKQLFERQFKLIKDVISEKKERVVLDLSEDQLQALGQLQTLLQERKEERQEIKLQLEAYRKAVGSSGFDFEKAMMYRELMESDKVRLQKAETAIQEIEDKIDQLEG